MRAVLRWLAIGAGIVLMVAAGVGWATYRKLSGNIRTDRAAERVLSRDAAQRPRDLVPHARNILVIGGGQGDRQGAVDPSGMAVLLHLSADRHRAAAVGVPGGLRLDAARCGAAPASLTACAIRAFERLSGIRVDHHLVVDHAGFQRIASAVGGAGAGSPSASGPGAGPQGGDGGALLRALAAEARAGGGTLAHPTRLYGLLNGATSSITADPGLSSLPALYALAGSLRALPPGGLVVRTVPLGGRGAPREPYAGRLFAALREDRPLTGVPETS